MRHARQQHGFTLVEMVMVIVILGIVGAMVAVFMRAPVDAYFDTARRAALTDVADTALRRIARDIHKALPNSVRTNGAGTCIEFIPTRIGGRYRVQDSTPGSALNFSIADTTFNMLGSNAALPADQQIRANDLIVVYNLGIPGADAYAGDNTATVANVVDGAETAITFTAGRRFPLTSPNNRFHVVPVQEPIVSYVCTGNQLWRNVGYGFGAAASCPAAAPAAPGSRWVLADGVAACAFTYAGNDLQRNGLVQMAITLTDAANETVTLYHTVHVNNTP